MLIWLCAALCLKSGLAEFNSDCVTPNGEDAKCISIHSCTVIKQAVAFLHPDVIDFARKSQCGYENGPLVCCGTKSNFNTPSSTTPTVHAEFEDKKTSLAPLGDHSLPDNSLCGIQIKQTDNKTLRGSISDIYDFPWMVALMYTKGNGDSVEFRCSGTLISKNFALTAAQCLDIKGFNLIKVRLGEWMISRNIDCAENTETETVCSDAVIDLKIVEQISHPFFNSRTGSNNIALLKLEKKVSFTDFIRPICLPPPDLPEPKDGTLMEISGWGITEEGQQSDYKLRAQVPVFSNKKCKQMLKNDSYVNSYQACAEEKNACRGDAGGPIMSTFKKKDILDDEQWYQEGILFKGIGCDPINEPTLYTRICRYSKWILNTIHASSSF